MKSKSYKYGLFLILLVIAVFLIWNQRYTLLYQYYLWKLNHTGEGGEIMDIDKEIEKISPHIIPDLVRTYENTNNSSKSRGAAALGLITADKNKAETLFIKYLDSKDDEIVSLAIVHLGLAQSTKAYDLVLKYKNSNSEEIRFQVVSYLGFFNTPESVSLIKEMYKKDPSSKVRDHAYAELVDMKALREEEKLKD